MPSTRNGIPSITLSAVKPGHPGYAVRHQTTRSIEGMPSLPNSFCKVSDFRARKRASITSLGAGRSLPRLL